MVQAYQFLNPSPLSTSVPLSTAGGFVQIGHFRKLTKIFVSFENLGKLTDLEADLVAVAFTWVIDLASHNLVSRANLHEAAELVLEALCRLLCASVEIVLCVGFHLCNHCEVLPPASFVLDNVEVF